MGDYFQHWLEIGQRDGAQLPKLFWVNWFRKGDDGKFLWPGFGENSRVLKWVVERVAGTGDAVDTPIGRVPAADAVDTTGMDLAPTALDELLVGRRRLVAGGGAPDRGALRLHRRHAPRSARRTSSWPSSKRLAQ